MLNALGRWLALTLLLAVEVLVPTTLLGVRPARAADRPAVSVWAIDVSTVVKEARFSKRSMLTTSEIVPGKGVIADLKRANVIAGQVGAYETPHERISVGLVEYRQHQWAVSGTTYKGATSIPRVAPGASFGWVRTDAARSLGIVGVKGRIAMEVWVHAPTGSTVTEGLQFEQAKELYTRQFAAVPILPDLPGGRQSPAGEVGHRFAKRLGIGVFVIGVIFSVVGWLVGWWSDAGSREWLCNSRRGDRSVPGLVDVTPAVRRGLMLRSLVPVARMTVLVAGAGILIVMPGLRLTLGFLLVGAFVLGWGLAETLLRRHRATAAVARGRAALIVTALGASASVFVVVAGLTIVSAGISAELFLPGLRSARIGIPMLLLGLAIVGWSRRPIRLARRLLQPLVRRQIEVDERRPILLLRSFQDDALEVRPPGAAAGTWDGFVEEPYVRFEEVVAWEAWRFGALRAVGQPETLLQPLGAVRDYFSDNDWQEAVEKEATDARAIVLIVGRSPGLVWEIGNLRAHGRLAKTVFVIPPVPREETVRRLSVLASALELDPAHVVRHVDGRVPLALTFNSDGRPVAYVVAGRISDAYRVAVNRALAAIPDRPCRLTAPAADVQQSSVDISEHLVAFDPRHPPRPHKPLVARLASAALWLIPI